MNDDVHGKPKRDSRANQPELTQAADPYTVPVLAKALDMLELFDPSGTPMSLAEVVRQSGVSQTTVYRILHTLCSRGYLSRTGSQYRLNRLRERPVIGFANCSRHIALAVDIQKSLEAAARAIGINLLVWDNDRDAEVAIKNAKEMIEHKVDIAVQFQLHEHIAPVILDLYSRAGIPLIAVVNPIYGAQYFGVDNYRAGISVGEALGEYARRSWRSRIDSIVVMESPRAGRMVQSRLVGAIRALESKLGSLDGVPIDHLDGGGEREPSRSAVARYFRGKTPRHVMIIAINDESAVGAAEATKRLKSRGEIAIVGYGGSAEILELIEGETTPCIGTASFRAEAYGPALINFALPLLQHRAIAPACYVPHEYLDKQSLARKSQSLSVIPAAGP